MNLLQKSASAAALLFVLNAGPVVAATDAVPISAPVPVGLPATPVTGNHFLPVAITVAGKAVSFDQPAIRQGETLYVPLRFIAEAAGGHVEWDGASQTVTVALPDRSAMFVVGQDQAEMNQHGVVYIQRNMLQMAGPVQLMGGRTMVAADALTTILGLFERPDRDMKLDLIADPAAAPVTPPAGKLIPGEAQATAVQVVYAEVPSDLQDWATAVANDESASYKAVVGADDNVIVGLSGGLQPSGGYTFELLGGGARLVDETWYLDVKLVPPTEMAATVMTNPVAFFKLPGVIGNVVVNFWDQGVTP